jgi:hypothetical protein
MISARLPLLIIVLVAALAQARAAPLDADTCAKLQVEQEELENAGVEKDMAKGPAWAKDNLPYDKLVRVKRFIEIEEQLLFRCRNKAIVHLPPETEAATAGDRGEDKDDDDDNGSADNKADKDAPAKAAKPAAAPVKGADKKAPVQPAPARKQDAAGAKKPAKAVARQTPELSSEPGVTAIEKRPAKTKVDDAYKVPPPDPNVNPFTDQLKLPMGQ